MRNPQLETLFLGKLIHMSEQSIISNPKQAVRQQYGATAQAVDQLAADQTKRVAQALGYSNEDLAIIPADANLGLSCGNPIDQAQLLPGETVVDLGSGGGMDVFLAASKVGPTGCAIGIDMTDEMIALARKNAVDAGIENVRFYKSEIENMPLDDGEADCVVSNCVINLCEDKYAVLEEVSRILKPGGRAVISDIVLKQPLPDELKNSLEAYVGCIAGAISIDDYRDALEKAGFGEISLVDTGVDLNVYGDIDGQSVCCAPVGEDAAASSSCCGPSTEPAPSSVHQSLKELVETYDLNQYAASVIVHASK